MNLDEFRKGSFEEWFMPLWSLTELLGYRDRFYPDVSDAVVNRLFEHWDGLIRYVIIKPFDYMARQLNDEQIVAQVDETFDVAIGRSDIRTLQEFIDGKDRVSKDEDISNKIILLDIDTSTFEKREIFMTRHARKLILAQLKTKSQEELFKLLESFPILQNASAAVNKRLHGFFEDIAEYILAEGGNFAARKMVDKGESVSRMIRISFPKRELTTANYTSYSKLQDKAAQEKQAVEKANVKKAQSDCKNNSQAKNIVQTIISIEHYTNLLFRINHSFPTIDCVCYFNESISEDETVEKGPCTFQLTVGADHSNNVTWDSYTLFDSLYSSSNERKIKHFIVVHRSNFEKFIYKNSFKTSDPVLIEHMFEKIISDKDKGNAYKSISEIDKVNALNIISEAEKAITEKATCKDEKSISDAKKTIFEAKKFIANKAISEIFEQRVDQYCLKIK